MIKEFDGDDKRYQEWLINNPDGFVLNLRRSRTPAYMVLHRAHRHTVNPLLNDTMAGGFPERGYVKVVANSINELRQWVQQHGRPDGAFSDECSKYSR